MQLKGKEQKSIITKDGEDVKILGMKRLSRE